MRPYSLFLGRVSVSCAAVLASLAGCDLPDDDNPGTLVFQPTNVQLQASTGDTTPAQQAVDLVNMSTGTTRWSSSCSESWLSLTPAQGAVGPSLAMVLHVAADPSGLPVGTHAATIVATSADGSGVASATLNVSLTVIPGGPSAPVVTSSPDTAAQVGVQYTYQVTATGSPQPTFSLDAAALAAGLAIDVLSGLLTWTPQVVGSQAVTVTATNAAGTDTQDFTITVTTTPNNAPTANDDTETVAEDSVDNVIDVLANDSDPDVGDTVTVVSATDGSYGTVTIGAGGANVLYTPDPDFEGEDSFTYVVQDDAGATDTATVTVTVTGVNDAPVANDDSPSAVQEDSADNVILVLVNDTDADTGDTLAPLKTFKFGPQGDR